MNLSPHFTLEEFTFSQTASRRNLSNDPPVHTYANLKRTAEGLELVRTLLGNPIRITSGYRSPAVNDAVGSKGTSQHTLGQAADFLCPAFGNPKKIVAVIADSAIAFDQLICEYPDSTNGGWVHISFSPKNRLHVLTIDKNGTRSFS